MGRRVHHLLTVGAGYKEGIESQIHNWLILKSWDILDGRHSTARPFPWMYNRATADYRLFTFHFLTAVALEEKKSKL